MKADAVQKKKNYNAINNALNFWNVAIFAPINALYVLEKCFMVNANKNVAELMFAIMNVKI